MKVEHRRDKRSHIFLNAMLRLPDGEFEVKLTNLSSFGACANYPVTLAIGTEVQISRGDLTVPGRIAWSVEGKIGIEFVDPLNLQEFRTRGQTSAPPVRSPLHRPVEKLSPRLRREWAKMLSR